MSIASIDDALAQYNANLSWQSSQDSAAAALEAVRYLLVNRAQRMEDSGTTLNYESLQQEAAKLEQFLGATAPRAFGRTRRLQAAFGREGVQ